jgi:hypothetical protein
MADREARDPVDLAAHDWSEHVADVMHRQIHNGLELRATVSAGEYDAEAWQNDVTRLTSEWMNDSMKSMSLLADLARAMVDVKP